jgi:hypothetical protein
MAIRKISKKSFQELVRREIKKGLQESKNLSSEVERGIVDDFYKRPRFSGAWLDTLDHLRGYFTPEYIRLSLKAFKEKYPESYDTHDEMSAWDFETFIFDGDEDLDKPRERIAHPSWEWNDHEENSHKEDERYGRYDESVLRESSEEEESLMSRMREFAKEIHDEYPEFGVRVTTDPLEKRISVYRRRR